MTLSTLYCHSRSFKFFLSIYHNGSSAYCFFHLKLAFFIFLAVCERKRLNNDRMFVRVCVYLYIFSIWLMIQWLFFYIFVISEIFKANTPHTYITYIYHLLIYIYIPIYTNHRYVFLIWYVRTFYLIFTSRISIVYFALPFPIDMILTLYQHNLPQYNTATSGWCVPRLS